MKQIELDFTQPPVSNKPPTCQPALDRDQLESLSSAFGDICVVIETHYECSTCRAGFRTIKETLYAFIGDEGFIKDELKPLLERFCGQVLDEKWSDDDLSEGGTVEFDPRETHYQCLREEWDRAVWGYLKGYIETTKNDGWATTTYKRLKLGGGREFVAALMG